MLQHNQIGLGTHVPTKSGLLVHELPPTKAQIFEQSSLVVHLLLAEQSILVSPPIVSPIQYFARQSVSISCLQSLSSQQLPPGSTLPSVITVGQEKGVSPPVVVVVGGATVVVLAGGGGRTVVVESGGATVVVLAGGGGRTVVVESGGGATVVVKAVLLVVGAV